MATSGGTERSITIYDAVTIRFAKAKGDVFGRLLTVGVPELRVMSVPNGYVCGNGLLAHSAVLTRSRQFISELSALTGMPRDFVDDWVLREETRPPVSVSGRLGVLTGQPRWDASYYHWMFQVLPRLHLLRKSGIPVDRYLMNRLRHPFQHETLGRLGVDRGRIIEVDESYCVQADELVVPSVVPVLTPPWVCDFLRDALPAATESRDDRLYVPRPAHRNRKVANTGEIEPILEQFGFRRFAPEGLSVAKQAQAFASASVIAAPHGGALTNLVFCQPGTKVIEFFPPGYVHPIYWMLCSHCGLDHHFLLGRGHGADHSGWPRPNRAMDPIELDPDELTATLTNL